MRTRNLVAMAGALTGAPAVVLAQTVDGYTIVPASERLTFAGVIADASIEVQLLMVLMAAGALAAVVVWGMSLGKVGKGDARGVAAALGRLKIVRSGASPLGFLTAAYVLFNGFLGISNVRPAPDMTVLAPGFAEATLAIMLGLLASAVAVICERHLEGRVRSAAA